MAESGKRTGPRRIGLRVGAAALAMVGVSQFLQVAFFRLSGFPTPPAFFASHLAVLAAVYGGLALLLAGRVGDRAWAIGAFLMPVAAALAPFVWRRAGWAGVLLAVAVASGVITVCSWKCAGRGNPVLAAASGTVVAAELLRHVAVSRDGILSLGPLRLGYLTLLAGGLFAITAALGWRRKNTALLAPRLSAGIAALGLAAAWGLAGTIPSARSVSPPTRAVATAEDLPTVVLVILDTVRADHLAMNGYRRDTMPRLERFAQSEGIRAERAIANAPSSLPTHASIFTGRLPPNHGAHKPFIADPNPPGYAYPLPHGIPTLAELLARRGYWSVGISANFGALTPEYGIARGFHHFEADRDPTRSLRTRTPWHWKSDFLAGLLGRVAPFAACEYFQEGVPYRRAAAVVDRAIDVVEQAAGRPLFLFLNLFDAHLPYNPPRAYLDLYPGRQRHLAQILPPGVIDELMSGARDLEDHEYEHVAALYDAELRYVDDQLARLFELLSEHLDWEDTLVAVTSDHGEAIGEHRLWEHSTSLYEPMIEVPLVIKPARRSSTPVPPGAVLPGAFQSVDLFATILEEVAIAPPPTIDGSAWGDPEAPVFAWAYKHQRWADPHPARFERELRSVEIDGWKLVESTQGTVELYNLEEDPGEARNLAVEEPDRVEALAAHFPERVVYDPRARPRDAAESEETLERLRALGYVR